MLRNQANRIVFSKAFATTRLSGPSKVSGRRYVTGQDLKPQGSNNALLYTALGVATLGGAYYYFKRNPKQGENIKQKARADEEEMKQKARESVSAARARAGDAAQEVQQKYDETKDSAKKGLEGARGEVDKKTNESKARGRSIVEDVKQRSDALSQDAETKYDAYKDSAKQTAQRARESTEHYYDDARNAVERRASGLRKNVDEEAKQTWLSWLGWGRSKLSEGEERLSQHEKDIERRTDKDVRPKA